MTTVLKGAKSSPSESSTVQTSDNLRSKDTFEAILAICEGPIQGLTNGAKSFYVGDTALQNNNGDFNFGAFQLDIHKGEDVPDGPVISKLGGFSSSKTVNVGLKQNVPVVRPTDTGQLDFLEVRMAVLRLLVTNSEGTFFNNVRFDIEYKALSASTWKRFFNQPVTITGKTQSVFIKEYRKPVTRINEPYEIRVTKLTAENTDTHFSDISWESFQEVVGTPRTYPNTVIAHLIGEASNQFSSIPQFSGDYKGLLVKVPTNYDPVVRTYTGTWDGSFKIAWTDNPAWCLYDFITNDRYGVNAYYPATMDKFETYEAAQWCDVMVPDGAGGLQPRYTFNDYIQEPRSGKEMARYMAGVFNAGMFDNQDGNIILKVDKDEQAVAIFSQENVLDGNFEYSYSDLNTRFNDITVVFKNKALNYEEDRRRVFDQTHIDRHGRIPYDFIAVACTNAHEAIRRATHKLITSLTEKETVSFITNRLGQFVNPLDIILIADEDSGYGLHGRVKSLSLDRKTITLRDPLFLEVGVQYVAKFQLPDSLFEVNVVEGQVGSLLGLELTQALPSNLPDRAVFSLESPGFSGVPKPFRIIDIDEETGDPDNYRLVAVEINRNKVYASDNAAPVPTQPASTLPNPLNPPGPISVGFFESLVKSKKEFHLTVNPIFDRGTYKYYSNDFEVWSRLRGTADPYVRRTIDVNDTIINHPPGDYQFKILGISLLGAKSDLRTVPSYFFNVANAAELPPDVLTAWINDKEIHWLYDHEPIDFDGFRVKYHNVSGKFDWEDGLPLHNGLITTTYIDTDQLPQSARVILIKAVDIFGFESETAAVIQRNQGDPVVDNVTDQVDLHTLGWPGPKTNMFVDVDELKASDDGALFYTGIPTAKKYDGGNLYKLRFLEGEYLPTFTIVGTPARLVVSASLVTQGYELSYRHGSGAPMYEGGSFYDMGGFMYHQPPWIPLGSDILLQPGIYQLRIRTFAGGVQSVLSSLSVIYDHDDVEEVLEDVAIEIGGTRLNIQKEYIKIKIVNWTLQEDINDAFTIKTVDKNPVLGPLVKAYNIAGEETTGTADFKLQGY